MYTIKQYSYFTEEPYNIRTKSAKEMAETLKKIADLIAEGNSTALFKRIEIIQHK